MKTKDIILLGVTGLVIYLISKQSSTNILAVNPIPNPTLASGPGVVVSGYIR